MSPPPLDSLELLKEFITHISAEYPELSEANTNRVSIDWDLIQRTASQVPSLEQGIGRAVVIVDQMRRKVVEGGSVGGSRDEVEAGFFSFSVDDVVPDFGDRSRYRTRVTRRIANILRPSRHSEESQPEENRPG